QPNREAVLVQLRRERGLTSAGLYGLPSRALSRLVLQSGLTIGLGKLALLVAGAAIGLFVVVLWLRADLFQAAFAAIVFALLLPFAALHVMRSRRHKRLGEQFADAIDIIVRSLRAGHPVPIAVSMVAREMSDPVGTEFGIVADEITYGSGLEAAMRNLAFRVGQDDLPLFVTAVAIQGST